MPADHPLLKRADGRYATPHQVIKAVEAAQKGADQSAFELLDMAANIVMSWAYKNNIPEGNPIDVMDAVRAGKLAPGQALAQIKAQSE